MTDAFRHVRIVAVPAGEAPLWVRQCWVGLDLPLATREPVSVKTFGVVSAPTTWIGVRLALMLGRDREIRGYAVHSAAAIAVLRATKPRAADWWSEHAPRFLEPSRRFVFLEAECRPVADGE